MKHNSNLIKAPDNKWSPLENLALTFMAGVISFFLVTPIALTMGNLAGFISVGILTTLVVGGWNIGIRTHQDFGLSRDRAALIRQIDSLPREVRAEFGDYRELIANTKDDLWPLENKVRDLVTKNDKLEKEKARMLSPGIESLTEIAGTVNERLSHELGLYK
jgi:hypothetical protein